MSGIVKSIRPDSVAAKANLRAGDLVHTINAHALRDVIDAQFYGAEDAVEFGIERDGTRSTKWAQREYGEELGIEFEHPTLDIDIRRCNNLCPFCFVLQNGKDFRRGLYIKDDDYRYSFLFGHFVTLTNLSDEDWQRIAEQQLSPLYVSVHCTNTAIRQKCLSNPKSQDIMQQLRWLAAQGIEMHTQLVVTPGLNDGEHLRQSVADLATLYPHVRSVSVVPVGLTKNHKYGLRPHTARECADVIAQVQTWQADFVNRFGVRFVYCTDEWYLVAGQPLPKTKELDGLRLHENGLGMVRNFLNEWQRVKRKEIAAFAQSAENGALKFSSATLATATLFAPTLAHTARDFSRLTRVPLDAVPIRNTRLGETITVAGLLCARDVIEQLSARRTYQASDLVVLPRIMFDHPQGIALDDLAPMDVARALGCTVALADWMGDVLDALSGANKLMFDPLADPLNVPIVREGGWAVEKYL
jgi:putative radical SAM enzyme (TIGR03279 family)